MTKIFLTDFVEQNWILVTYTDFNFILKENNELCKKKKYIVDSKVKMNMFGEKINLCIKAYRLLQHLKSKKVQSLFPNVEVALRIFLSMAVTNCNEERSFSALGRMKNFSRPTLRQDKMKALALLVVESELVESISFDEKVESFAIFKIKKNLT